MVRQRLVDRPEAPTRVALAGGRDRRADRRRVVAVVVEHHDAADLALELEPAADAVERREPGQDRVGVDARGEGAARRHQRVDGHVPPDGPRRTRSARRPARAGRDLEVRPVAVLGDDGPGDRSRPSRRRLAVGEQPDAEPPRRASRPGASSDAARRPRSPTLATSVGGSPVAEPLRPIQSAKAAHHRRLVGEHVRVVPFGADQDRDVRAVRVEVAGVLVGLDDEVAARPDPRVAALRRRRSRPAAAPRRTPTGRARPPTSTWTQPAGGRGLAVRPGDRDQAPAAGRGRVGDDLLPRSRARCRPRGPPRARGGRGRPRQRLGDREPIQAARRPRRGRGPASCCQAIGIPARLDAPAVAATARRRRSAVTTAPAAAARSAAAAAPAPAAPTTWMRSRADRPRGTRRAPGRAPIVGRRRASRGRRAAGRSSSERQSAAAALATLVAGPVAGPLDRRTSSPAASATAT